MIARTLFLIPFIIGLSVPTVHSQSSIQARFVANTGAPLAGEPIELRLMVEAPQNSEIVAPEFPEEWVSFTIREVAAPEIIESDDDLRYEQVLTVILWSPGDFRTPEMAISVQLPDEPNATDIAIEPAFFTVPSVLTPADRELRPFKSTVSLRYVSPLLIFGVVASLLTLLGGIAKWRDSTIGIMPSTAEVIGNIPAGSPAEIAFSQLRSLQTQKLRPAQIFQAVSNCLRGYVQDRLDVEALEMTTTELIAYLQVEPAVPPRQRRQLQTLLEQSDLVKFARHQPQSTTAHRLLNAAFEWVQSVENQISEEQKP